MKDHKSNRTYSKIRHIGLALPLCLLGACMMPGAGRGSAKADPEARAVGWSSIGEGTLYARDGTPVSTRAQAIPPGATPEQGPAPHRTVEPPGESRTYLLELYQVAIEDKERLALEVDTLEETLSETIATNRTLEEERRTWMTERDTLLADKKRLEAQNFELAERLTTAQIRRLEAEGMLLEAALERTRAAAAAQEDDSEETSSTGSKTSWASRPSDKR